MSDIRIPAIPTPEPSVESLLTVVQALKQAVEMLTGQTASGSAIVPAPLQAAVNRSVGDTFINTIDSQIAQAQQEFDQQLTTAQEETDAALAELNSALTVEAQERQNADQSIITLVQTLTTVEGNESIQAALVEESLARANADNALAAQITTLQTSVGTNTSAIQTESVTRANADTALSGQINSLTSSVNSNAAAITAEQVARANADSAITVQVNNVSAVAGRQRVFSQTTTPTAAGVGDLWIDTANQNLLKYWDGSAWQTRDDGRIAVNAAAISSESIARANADSALTAQINSLTSTVNGNTAAITSEASTRATADTALSGQISTLSANVSTNAAAISNEAIARAAADGALTTQINSVSAQSNAGTANGRIRMTAVSGTGGSAAEYAVEVSTDGTSYSRAGMNMQAFSGGTSRVTFVANQFLITNGTNTFAPFQVGPSGVIANALTVPSGNVTGLGAFATASQINPSNIATYIATAAISDAYISNVSASKITVSELSAFTANLGTVTAGVARSADSKFVIDFTNARITISD